MPDSFDAVVVGAGPNGLTAAATLATAGYSVCVLEAAAEPGGGTRTVADGAIDGVVHDHCAAVHPLAAASPAFRALSLAAHGLDWVHPEVVLAHPFDDGSAAVLVRDLDATAHGLGRDGGAWRRLVEPAVANFDAVAWQLLGPVLRVPRRPAATARAIWPAVRSAAGLCERFSDDRSRALFGGIAAHAVAPLDRPATGGVGLLLAAAGHAVGWPFARGGSAAIWRALVDILLRAGGELRTDWRVRQPGDIPPARMVLFDVVPRELLAILGEELPRRHQRRFRRWRHGPAAYKVDYVVEGGVPWIADEVRRAGTVHLTGSFDELVAAELAVAGGRHAARPFVLVTQPGVADVTRRAGTLEPVWAYGHVPHASRRDSTAAIDAQIERFAPGFLERVRSRRVTTPAEFAATNPNFVGGDIAGGASTTWQLIARSRRLVAPYSTGRSDLLLCSAATPPGAGVHGMGGWHAAQSALRTLR